MPPEGQGYQDPRFAFGRPGSDFTREATELSSIDLATEEDYEDASRGFPVSEPPPRRGMNLPTAAFALFAAVVACGSLAVLVPLMARPGGLHTPLLGAGGSPGIVTARQLLEGPELTTLAATRLQAAEPELIEVAGAEAMREEVALGFKDAAALASYRLDALQLTVEQKEAVLRVLRDLTDEPRLHSTGLSVARALLAGGMAGAGTQRVLERLAPHMAEVRQLRDEVIPDTLRLHARSASGEGQLTLDQRQFRIVETLSNRWNFELDASLPEASSTQTARRLASNFGIDPQTGTFVEDMREQAMDAKNALASTQADLASALQGLSAAAAGTSTDTADQQQIAKSTACTVITEAKNAMSTVRNSLTNMMARIAQVRGRVEDGKGKHLARTIFRNLQVDVAEVNTTLGLEEAEFSKMLATTQPNVYKTDSNSLILTKSNLMVVQNRLQDVQAKLTTALKEFKAMYNVYKGKGNVYNTVRMYASSAFYQLQETFNVPLPAIDNASAVLRDCLRQPDSDTLGQLQCRLSYAQLCLELMLGMDAKITVESTGMPTLAPLPGVGVSSAVISPNTVTSTTLTVTTQTTTTLNETEAGFDLIQSAQNTMSHAGNWFAGVLDKFSAPR